MAARAQEIEPEEFREGYVKPFAAALLDETCQGGKALNAGARASLEKLLSASE
jgi:hypothetical protein